MKKCCEQVGNSNVVQLDDPAALVRSWVVESPRFYGMITTDAFVDQLLEHESALLNGTMEGLDPQVCRVLAAFHGSKGAKVPLTATTIAGCVRPAFVGLNPGLVPGGAACYGGGCYLYHARAVPAKNDVYYGVQAHRTPKDKLLAAARLSRHFGLPIRDNQTSDGSLSMALRLPQKTESQLEQNLEWLTGAGYSDVPYLCFSSAYVNVRDDVLQILGKFSQIVIHVTVSGWHSRAENILRLNEFERYSTYISNTCLRVVNRQDWWGAESGADSDPARCEKWLLGEIQNRDFSKRVIRTPFHSIHSFPGSSPKTLGSRHMAGTSYTDLWKRLSSEGARDCCSTGKCKTCPTACGATNARRYSCNPIVAARALESMFGFEIARQRREGANALGAYTARILARKSMEAYRTAGNQKADDHMGKEYERLNDDVASLVLTTLQRRRLVNDSHALVQDGMDRHGLWRCVNRAGARVRISRSEVMP